MDLQLKDHVAFIAGSSRGIGKAIAAALLQEGARVVLTGRDETSLRSAEAELSAHHPSHVLALAGDFSDPDTIAAALQRTVSRFGKIDHLIANLGTGSGQLGWNHPETEWQCLFNLNFFASTRLAQAAIPHLQANPSGGSILFLSSIVSGEATQAPLPYSAAKAALDNYAKNLSRQLAPLLRVNTLAPGNIFFPGGSWERHLANRPDAVRHMLQTEVPQQRFGTPQQIASLAAYLCSPLAAFATGSRFVMDGGQTHAV